ncbi:MAG TPA: SDR family NAD(P)-dependent oxidoreductase [Isosphaeraceae bacterium]|jgi:short-subunit dehydrogenase|nr:SDR family NAD(P)-dependent oxidoreductase [Isosphaeraceae bacterium]
MRQIQSEVAVITGASSGIGAELARRLAAAGVRVGLTARRAEALEHLAAAIRAQGGTAAVAPADAADPAATRLAMARLSEELGPVDLLIANAGVGLDTPAVRFSAAQFEEMVRVNLIGAAVAIESVLPLMLERRQGHIVGISSLAAYRGLPHSAGYSATKAGLSTLLEGLRVELRPRGLMVTTVHPGYVRTPMTADSGRPQPFLMEVGPAAEIILNGIAARRREINFPWRAAFLMGLLRRLPGGLYDRLAGALLMPREQPAESSPP